ncbi:MAG: hypothetical protein EOP11_17335 [Proteobacteria bacterium]|nr:MAG: hypothetical protein EOP11_17335 [Pseudomonadota bacterium]
MKKFLILALAGLTLAPALPVFGSLAGSAIRIEKPDPGSRPNRISWTREDARVVMNLSTGAIEQTIAGRKARVAGLEAAFKSEVRRQMPADDELALLVVDHKPAIRALGL